MQINILEKVYTFNNSLDEIPNVINKITEIATKNNLIVDHIVVEGIDIYEPISDFLVANIGNIDEVNVVTFTEKEYHLITLEEVKKYLVRALPEINTLVTTFYKNDTDDVWNSFQQFLEGIEWIVKILRFNENKEENYRIVLAELNFSSSNLLSALESKDMILIADIMSYEIVPTLSNLNELLDSVVNC